jgi:hypothetical protein
MSSILKPYGPQLGAELLSPSWGEVVPSRRQVGPKFPSWAEVGALLAEVDTS